MLDECIFFVLPSVNVLKSYFKFVVEWGEAFNLMDGNE